jgi:phytoene synthase
MEAQWKHRLIALASEAVPASHRLALAEELNNRALVDAYERAAAITREHSKSFYLASGLLPSSRRHAMRALYAFCRTVDDIVDACAGCDSLTDLDAWRQITRSAVAPAGDPVATAWVDTLKRFHIPSHFALQLIEGVSRDIALTRYESFDDLSTYCYDVASTVGLMSMYIVGFASRDAIPYAIQLGVALQMTNILRDVGEDFRNGRIYLPQEELRAFDITEADLANGRVTDRWRAFMRFQIDRARRLYAEAAPGIQMLERDGRFAIAAASGLYREILDKIEHNNYDVFSRRASLSAWEKIARIPALFLELQRSRRGQAVVRDHQLAR